MDILLLLIPLSVVLVLVIGAGFWWSVASGQFDDLEGPAHRILADDDTSDVIPDASSASADAAPQHAELTSIKLPPDRRP
jgi:cbb3-type cytochrome oxidase maturation protein